MMDLDLGSSQKLCLLSFATTAGAGRVFTRCLLGCRCLLTVMSWSCGGACGRVWRPATGRTAVRLYARAVSGRRVALASRDPTIVPMSGRLECRWSVSVVSSVRVISDSETMSTR